MVEQERKDSRDPIILVCAIVCCDEDEANARNNHCYRYHTINNNPKKTRRWFLLVPYQVPQYNYYYYFYLFKKTCLHHAIAHWLYELVQGCRSPQRSRANHGIFPWCHYSVCCLYVTRSKDWQQQDIIDCWYRNGGQRPDGGTKLVVTGRFIPVGICVGCRGTIVVAQGGIFARRGAGGGDATLWDCGSESYISKSNWIGLYLHPIIIVGRCRWCQCQHYCGNDCIVVFESWNVSLRVCSTSRSALESGRNVFFVDAIIHLLGLVCSF